MHVLGAEGIGFNSSPFNSFLFSDKVDLYLLSNLILTHSTTLLIDPRLPIHLPVKPPCSSTQGTARRFSIPYYPCSSFTMDSIHMSFDPLIPMPDSMSFMAQGAAGTPPSSSTGLPLAYDSYYSDWMGEGAAPLSSAADSSNTLAPAHVDYHQLGRSQQLDQRVDISAAGAAYPSSTFAPASTATTASLTSREAGSDALSSSQRLPSLGTLLSGYPAPGSPYSNPFQQPAGAYPTPSMAPSHLADAPANGHYPHQNGLVPGYPGANGVHEQRHIAGRRKSPVGAVRPRGAVGGMAYLDTTGENSGYSSPSNIMPGTPLSVGPASTFGRSNSSDHRPQSPRTPQADESVPEAALHLLRLALPTGSTGSVATATTLDDDDAGISDDAEGESDATSYWSGEDQKPKRHRKSSGVKNGGRATAGSRRTSASSVASNRRASAVRQHRPARTQREQSTSTRAGSEEYRRQSMSSAGRRTSGRVRKTVLPTKNEGELDLGSDSDLSVDDFSDSDESAVPSDDDDSDVGKHGKKRKASAKGKGKAQSLRSPSRVKNDPDAPAPKKAKKHSPGAPRRPRRIAAPVSAPSRSFPHDVDISDRFPRMYRQFPVSSAFPPESYVNRLRPINALNHHSHASHSSDLPGIASAPVNFMDCPEGSKWNKASDPFNLYAPRFVKGNAEEKSGLCPICVEPVERGGEATERWLKLKNSSYVYHMSYAHGLSNLTGLPFSPPTKLRSIQLKPTTKDARNEMTEGHCHKCNKWIPLLSVKNVEAVVPELIWWKHAKPCHGNTSIAGEGDYHIRDSVYDLVMARKNGSSGGSSTQQNGTPMSSYQGTPVANTSSR